MRTLTLLVALVALPALPATSQDVDTPEGTPIRAAEVSGVPFDQLSPELRGEITALAGVPLSRERLRELATRIEAEQPETVAAVRSVALQDGGVRVVFLVARISEDSDLLANINARYVVESVEISGIDETTIREDVLDELQTLVGKRLDPDEAERLTGLLAGELPDHDVKRRVERGSEPGRVRVIFDVSEVDRPWIPFLPSRSKIVYHASQGWSGVLDIPMGGRDHRFALGFAARNEDDLIEEYSGYRLRVESRRLATDRLGASLEYSRLNPTWRAATLSVLSGGPGIPEPYRVRRTIEPAVTVAFSPNLRLTAGASISELGSLSHPPDSQKASAGVFSITVDRRWRSPSGSRHHAGASWEIRAASPSLDSDLDYTRHSVRAHYRYSRARSTVISDLRLGSVRGEAPLFERFTLGDTSTLRGWNKYDIAPAGGSRLFHHTLEYRYRVLGVFLDAGSVWEPDAPVRTRLSTGFGLHGDNAFLTLGVPLNADDVRVTVMIGVRF